MAPDRDPWLHLARAARGVLPAPPPRDPDTWRTRAAHREGADPARPWTGLLPGAVAMAATLAVACCLIAWWTHDEAGLLPPLVGGGWP